MKTKNVAAIGRLRTELATIEESETIRCCRSVVRIATAIIHNDGDSSTEISINSSARRCIAMSRAKRSIRTFPDS